MMNFANMTTEQLADYRERVAVLNDQLRANLDRPATNIVVTTQGILAMVDDAPLLAAARQMELMSVVASYATFSEDNNPHCVRDFVPFDLRGTCCDRTIDVKGKSVSVRVYIGV